MNRKNSPTVLCSTIITTIGRPTLARTVESVLSQDARDAYEVIVVNDSGKPLPAEDWQRSERVTILATNRRERCFARNAGASIARGAYLHFLDDDDWMLPNAFRELWKAASGSNASLIYGTTRVIDREGTLLAEHHIGVHGNAFAQVMAGELFPLLSTWFESKAFFEAGGFQPRFVWAEDWDIGRRIALRGDVVSTRFPVACLVRDNRNSTTNYAKGRVFNRLSVDIILNEKGSFTRMLASAQNQYWRGKIVRTYLTGMMWDLRNRRFLNALRRASEAAASLALFATHIASLDFWRSLCHGHDSLVNS